MTTGTADVTPGASATVAMASAADLAVLRSWGRGPASTAAAGDVCQWFEARAALAPMALAVRDGERRTTYGELDARASRLARQLRVRGVTTGSVVALAMERSVEMAVSMLAVLKSGGAYLPLDVGHPPDRLAYILNDAQVALLLTRRAEPLPELARWPRLVVEDAMTLAPGTAEAPRAPDPGALAYVIYTSGSTGRPKGVEVEHGALSNVVAWHVRTLGIGPSDNTAQLAGAAFDASLLEWWGALASGASIHIVDEATRSSASALVTWLAREAITVAFMPTVLAEAAMEERWPAQARLRALFVGGDVLRRAPAAGQAFTVYNDYGPTEAAIVSTCEAVVAPTRDGSPAPGIGRPIDGVSVYLLDQAGRPVPVGAVGELHLGGIGLARGYRNQPALTAERFGPDPFSAGAGARMYRTGDRARYRPDGTLEFVGRLDDQVKIRGYRIELGEVQAALLANDDVRQAVVQVHDEGGQRRLVAHVELLPGSAATAERLLADLGRWLPAYMVPASLRVLEAMPTGRNGKIDGAALRALEQADAAAAYVAPVGPTERELAKIWADLFLVDVQTIGARSNFFALGGHSLLLMRMISAIRFSLGATLPLTTLFDAADLRAMAALVDAASTGREGMDAGPDGKSAPQTEEMEW